MQTDESRQEKRSAAVGHQANFGKSLDKTTVLGRYHKIAGQRNIGTCSRCYPIDCRNNRFFDAAQQVDNGIVMFVDDIFKTRMQVGCSHFF